MSGANSSSNKLNPNISRHIDFYNEQQSKTIGQANRNMEGIKAPIDRDPAKISWTRALENDLVRNRNTS